MSFLHPLFLGAAAAVLVPLLLHLARRRTRREQPWSSLLFLTPSRPRLERRQRVEHWLLLAARAAALLLLALTFARPFLPKPPPALAAATGKRLLVLLDTSASMGREGLWAAARGRALQAVSAAGDGDRLALLTFDEQVQTVVSFEAWGARPAGQRRSLVETRLATLAPGHRATDLGAALVAAGEAVLDDQTARAAVGPSAGTRVILVSDLQEGSRLSALTAADWPAGVTLQIERVGGDQGVNLGLQALPPALAVVSGDGQAGSAPAPGARVRVTTSGGTPGEVVKATLQWKGDQRPTPTEVIVIAGESQEVPARPAALGSVVLTGDRAPFDNELHLAPPVATPARIVYVGLDAQAAGTEAAASTPASDGRRPTPLFFLQRAFPVTRARLPRVQAFVPGDPALAAALAGADLVVVTAALPEKVIPDLRRYLDQGRLLVLAPLGAAAESGVGAARSLLGEGLVLREGPAGREAVLTEVDLGHPILAPFADGRASDFTRVRFWKRRLLELDSARTPGARVLGRFDDGHPALVTVPVGRGQVFVMASSWDLADSQLALSSKLVPLLWTLLEASTGLASDRSQFFVGEPIPLPPASEGRRVVLAPDGRQLAVAATASVFTGAHQPGLYTVLSGKEDGQGGRTRRSFAVNLRPGESATAPLPVEHLERLGVRLHEGTRAATASAGTGSAVDRERQRQEAFASELEGQQRPWRFVLAAAFLMLIAETWLAGRPRGGLSTRQAAPPVESPS